MQISPGMTHPPSRLCLSDLRRIVLCKYRALQITDCSPRCVASYPLPVRQASALPSASFRFAVTRNTLVVRLTLPLAGCVEDFHLRVGAPCRARNKKSPPPFARWRTRELPVAPACYAVKFRSPSTGWRWPICCQYSPAFVERRYYTCRRCTWSR